MTRSNGSATVPDKDVRAPERDEPHEMNTLEWWEDYFSGDWLRYDGPAQTRHFMERLVASLPPLDLELLRQHASTIADWGCAFGEGTRVLAEAIPSAKLCGFDASARAIEQSASRHPALRFERIDPALPPGTLPRRFDVVVNSNCLEHFDRWQEVLRANLASTNLLHVSLVPYREQPLSVHHVVTLGEESFPATLDGFTRLTMKVIDVDPKFWPSGKQLLVAYASPRYLELRERGAGQHDSERAKWDAYYTDLAPQPIDAPTAAFNEELTGIIRELLPAGGAVLEAGCGGGSQSLAIANAGYEVALLDFSAAALEYAKKLFAANGANADFILGDAFAPGEPRFDLVFNAGVLEHYTLDEQAAFLRGMASRSRRFVLVLIPNRGCYWYWLWRIRRTASSAWPFGKEVPQTQLEDAFRAAGLNYIGQTFVGEGWTDAFINDCGLDEQTRDQILQIHRSPLLPSIAKGYLLAALGSVEPVEGSYERWQATTEFDERLRADAMAALADALAGRIAAEQRVASESEAHRREVAAHVDEIGRVRSELEVAARSQAEAAAALKLELQRRLDELNLLNGKLIESQRQLSEVSQWATRIRSEERERTEGEIARVRAEEREWAEGEAARVRVEERERADGLLKAERQRRLDELNELNGRLTETQRQLNEASEWATRIRTEERARADESARAEGVLRLELQRRLDELNVLNGKLIESQRQLHEVSEWATRIRAEERERAEAEKFETMQSVLELGALEKDQVARLRETRDRLAAALQRQQALEGAVVQAEGLRQELEATRVRAADLEGELARRAYARNTMARVRRAARLAASDPKEFARRLYRRLPMTPGTRHRVSVALKRILRIAPPVPPGTTVVASTPNFRPAPAMPDRADVFVFAIIDWHFRIQRPQHLSRELARLGHRVFYLTNHFADHAEPGFQFEQLDDSGRLFQIRLHVAGSPAIYFAPPSPADAARTRASLARMLLDVEPARSIALVEHPYWWDCAQRLPNSTVVYDCMDHHEGFGGMPEALLAIERAARVDADVLITTSDWLRDRFLQERPRVEMVRNACEYERFAARPADVWKDPEGRPVVGYYGAIAEWFDVELLDRLAAAYPDVCFRLVGSDTARVESQLSHHRNVQFTGERPYDELTYHLYGFDVCLLPFKVIPLTLATNPVKVYEYLAAGRTVVSVDLPELAQFGDLVLTAKDHTEFVAKVGQALATPPGEADVARRQAFAARQTWRDRATALSEAFQTQEEPLVSVVVLTYNNLALTQACLDSLVAHSDYPNLEIIVVDNLSTDGSREWLANWAEGRANVRLILNDTNAGFAAGNNIGLRAARGEYLVVLNNDTYVTHGWVRTLLRHFKRKPELGLLGAVTNNIGNEARIEIAYSNMTEMAAQAKRFTLAHPGESIPLSTAAFFCVMIRRAVYQSVGDMCEEYARGFFEDDDYCRRVEREGWAIECADDVFIHHHLSASFDALGAGAKRELFERNKAIYEAKWGDWQPHTYRVQRR